MGCTSSIQKQTESPKKDESAKSLQFSSPRKLRKSQIQNMSESHQTCYTASQNSNRIFTFAECDILPQYKSCQVLEPVKESIFEEEVKKNLQEINKNMKQYQVTNDYVESRKNFKLQNNCEENPAPYLSPVKSSSILRKRTKLIKNLEKLAEE